MRNIRTQLYRNPSTELKPVTTSTGDFSLFIHHFYVYRSLHLFVFYRSAVGCRLSESFGTEPFWMTKNLNDWWIGSYVLHILLNKKLFLVLLSIISSNLMKCTNGIHLYFTCTRLYLKFIFFVNISVVVSCFDAFIHFRAVESHLPQLWEVYIVYITTGSISKYVEHSDIQSVWP